MTFMRTYGLGAVGFTMLVTAIGLQWYIFAEGFFHQIYHYNSETEWKYIEIDMYTMMNCLFGISAVLISFGAVIGKVKPSQLIVMTIIELLIHAFNYECILLGGIKVADVGGTYADHMFGAYFGLAVSYMLTGNRKMDHQNITPGTGYVYDLFSLIGTLFLWIYWPSFVGGGLTADSSQQQYAIINTILCLSASTMITFYLSFHIHGLLNPTTTGPRRIFRPVDIQNATLAGGVAIGCSANFNMNPVNAIFIGIAAGAISTLGYYFIQPFLFEKLRIHDTCGVHNLHGMTSVIGAVASVVLAAYKQAESREHDTDVFFGHRNGQWWRQLVGMIAVLACAIIGGIVTGWIMRNIDPISPDDIPFEDSKYWEIADGYTGTNVGHGDDHLEHMVMEMVGQKRTVQLQQGGTIASGKRDLEEGKLDLSVLKDTSDTGNYNSKPNTPRDGKAESVADAMLEENNSLFMSPH